MLPNLRRGTLKPAGQKALEQQYSMIPEPFARSRLTVRVKGNTFDAKRSVACCIGIWRAVYA
jgi:hypothetical protein